MKKNKTHYYNSNRTFKTVCYTLLHGDKKTKKILLSTHNSSWIETTIIGYAWEDIHLLLLRNYKSRQNVPRGPHQRGHQRAHSAVQHVQSYLGVSGASSEVPKEPDEPEPTLILLDSLS